jgi:hypothetical protein
MAVALPYHLLRQPPHQLPIQWGPKHGHLKRRICLHFEKKITRDHKLIGEGAAEDIQESAEAALAATSQGI